MIKLLIVDDSIFMRTTLEKILSTDNIKVIGKASNGKDAVDMCLSLEPDVITMDIEMPIMNGIEAVREIMSKKPTPILMVSTLTSEGADSTINALSAGAIDFVTKSAAFSELYELKDELIEKVTSVAGKKPKRRILTKESKSVDISKKSSNISKYNPSDFILEGNKRPRSSDIAIIGIGISTGGPATLAKLIPEINPNIPVSIIVAQHMPAYFTGSLAKRLDNISKLTVKEAEDGEVLKPGVVYIAKGGSQTVVNRRKTINITDNPHDALYKPSVDVMMDSLMRTYMNKVLGIIMTGMGKDGTESMKKLKSINGYVIAQDEASCVLYGMPKSVINNGAACEITPLEYISHSINHIFGLN